MDISVILCTYNRCRQLAKALESATHLILPEAVNWEVLVVDNNSKDETREVVADFSCRFPGRFRYLFEPQPGKSFALNAGIKEAAGDILAFMDDDVVVDPGWLRNLTAGLLTGEWSGAGGRILPEKSFLRPDWLPLETEFAKGPLVIFDHGKNAGELKYPPYGTNMAFRKSLFKKHGGFRVDLGPDPNFGGGGEDSEFGARVLSQGERLRYEPLAIVYHSVPADRLQAEYFLKWWYVKGKADMRTKGASSYGRWKIRGIPVCLLRRIVVWGFRWLINFDPVGRFSCKTTLWMLAGAIVESFRLGKSATMPTCSGCGNTKHRPIQAPTREKQ